MVWSALWNRVSGFAGPVCLAIPLLLLPAGVRDVRADDGVDGRMSVDPALVSSEPAISKKAAAAPAVRAGDEGQVLLPRPARTEASPEVVVLNTRGYNYGPMPLEPAPASIGSDSEMPPPGPRPSPASDSD